jgi:hypothetical protein
MPGLDPGIHSAVGPELATVTEWIAGSSPAMTTEWSLQSTHSGQMLPPGGLVGAAGEEAGYGDVLVERFLMEAVARDFDVAALFERSVQQARKPRERQAEHTAVE